jgi:hypothetical protein
LGGGGFEKKVSPEEDNRSSGGYSGGVIDYNFCTTMGLVYNTCCPAGYVCLYTGVHIPLIHSEWFKPLRRCKKVPKRICKKNASLIVTAFILGIITSIIMPGWWWVLITGVVLVAAGCKILMD